MSGQPEGTQTADSQQQQRQYQQSQQRPQQPPQHQYRQPTLGDIFSRNDTKYEMKLGIALYTVVGVAIGVTIMLDYVLGSPELIGLVLDWQSGALIALILTVFITQEQVTILDGIPNNLVYGTAAVTAAVGTLVLLFFTWLFHELTAGTVGFGNIVGSWIAVLVGVVIIAVGTVAVFRNL